MKYIVCLGDGMSDEACEALDNHTPLEVANIPHINALAKQGQVGRVHTVPEGLHPGSDVANMGILGYDPRDYYTGRGPIEAASLNVTPPEGKLIFRCNLVTIENNTMIDFTAGHISNEEGAGLLKELDQHFGDRASFVPGVSYRNIALLNENWKDLTCSAPHDYTDKDLTPAWPKGNHENDIKAFIDEAHEVLMKSEINKKRLESGKKPATHIWPWSQGPLPKLPSFKEKFNRTGGIVTAVDLLKGLAVLSQLEAPHVEGATGFIDTDYKAKMAASMDILDRHDFVYIHIEAPDECGHMGDAKLKTKAIEDFDQNVVKPVLEYCKNNPDTAILLLPDHPTPCNIKTHTNDPVPFILYKPNLLPNTINAYTEKDAQRSDLCYDDPWSLMTDFLK